MTDQTSNSLTNTLVLALSQCQDQTRTIQEQLFQIDRLQHENAQLRKHLEDLRNKSTTNASIEESSQTERLFQKNVEAQAEISNLRRRLKSYKEKASRASTVQKSSPSTSPSTSTSSSAEVLSTSKPTAHRAHTGQSVAAQRDRHAQEHEAGTVGGAPKDEKSAISRSDDEVGPNTERSALAQISNNASRSRLTSGDVSKKDFTGKSVTAIPLLAEDGDEHTPATNHTHPEPSKGTRDNSVHRRLDHLLTASTPVKAALKRPRSRSPQPSDFRQRSDPLHHGKAPNFEIITPEIPSSRKRRRHSEEPDTAAPISISTTFESPSRFSSAGGRTRKIPKPTESLRTQPISRLSLTSFKPNPRWLSSHNVSYDDFLNDRQYERMRTIATSLPCIPAKNNGEHLTDHELLLDFLGPGSEERITSLTPVARRNLIIEAKTRRVAQQFKFSKSTGNNHDDDVPPGFWSTDMPSTQEAEEIRQAAKQKEREEVKRRYEDALEGQGRWIFTDEG